MASPEWLTVPEFAAIKRLRIENLELATENLKLRAHLDDLLDERRAS